MLLGALSAKPTGATPTSSTPVDAGPATCSRAGLPRLCWTILTWTVVGHDTYSPRSANVRACLDLLVSRFRHRPRRGDRQEPIFFQDREGCSAMLPLLSRFFHSSSHSYRPMYIQNAYARRKYRTYLQNVYTFRITRKMRSLTGRRAKTNLEKLPALLPIISVPWRTIYLCTQTEP